MPEQPPGDARARVEQLYDAHGRTLYGYALMLLADAAAAEDTVQQVFTSLLQSGTAIQAGFEIHYLRRAVRNRCYSELRRANRLAAQPLDEVGTSATGGLRWRDPPSSGLLEPHGKEANPEERLALEQGIRAMSPDQREVLHLHVFDGMTFQEIADATGESINTVASRYRYALARLRELLGYTDG